MFLFTYCQICSSSQSLIFLPSSFRLLAAVRESYCLVMSLGPCIFHCSKSNGLLDFFRIGRTCNQSWISWECWCSFGMPFLSPKAPGLISTLLLVYLVLTFRWPPAWSDVNVFSFMIFCKLWEIIHFNSILMEWCIYANNPLVSFLKEISGRNCLWSWKNLDVFAYITPSTGFESW